MQYDPLTTILTYKNVTQYLTIKSLIPPPAPVVTVNTDPSTATTASSKNNGSANTPSMQKRRMTRRSSTAESSATNTTFNTAEFDVDSDNEDNDDYTSLPSTAAANKSNKSTARGRPSMLSTSTKSAASTTSSASNNADANSGSAEEGAKVNVPDAVVANVKILDSWAEVEALGGADPSLIEMDPDMEGTFCYCVVPFVTVWSCCAVALVLYCSCCSFYDMCSKCFYITVEAIIFNLVSDKHTFHHTTH